MSAPTKPAPTRTGSTVPGAPALPQVNLLPPEVRANRQLGKVKGWLGVGLLSAVLFAGLLFVWSAFARSQAELELAAVEDQNAALLAEQAQFAEVPLVLRQLDEATSARTWGMSTEVYWRPYLGAIGATAPAGMSIDTFAFSGATPTEAPLASADPLRGPSVGTLTFQGSSATLPDIAAWMDALETVPGFADPWLQAAQITAEDGPAFYQVTGTVELTSDAYPARFADVEQEVG